MELAPQALIGEPTYVAGMGMGWELGVGVGVGGSFEDPSNVETTPSTPTPVLLQSPPFLFAPTLQIHFQQRARLS